MIVYGKASRRVTTGDAVDEVDRWIVEALRPGRAIERHAAWVSALVEAGGLAQGLTDAERDGDAALGLCRALADVMGRSWDTAFSDLPAGAPAAVADALAALRRLAAPPIALEIRRPEGFAHYATYPEAWWQAAASLPEPRPTRVLGLRSIGVALGAAAAAGFGAPLFRTARPHGHPFARAVALQPPLDGAERGAVWAVVDEGPGLSGSSMGAAAEALGRGGVAPDHVVLMPSHAGPPGAQASAAHRRIWAAARSAVVAFEELFFSGRAGRDLADWAVDLTGPLLAPPEDVAGGTWRRHLCADEDRWPAVDRQNERRKVLLHGRDRTVLLRFTGLGSFGRAKAERASALGAVGFGVAPLAWRHGFLAEPWRADLRPVALDRVDRPALLHRTARYLAFRATRFPALPDGGAPLDALLTMARVNLAEALGDDAAATLEPWTGQLPTLAAAARPVAVDGRLAPHDWLEDGAGLLLKTDALDHCCGHDLVGCQDIAWDVAGAAVEYGLTEAEVETLRDAVARLSGRPCEPALLRFFRLAYPAFRIGALAMARAREGGVEAGRLDAAIAAQATAFRRATGCR